MKVTVKFPSNVKIKYISKGIEAEFDDESASKYFEAKVINTKKNNIVTDDKRIKVTKYNKLTL